MDAEADGSVFLSLAKGTKTRLHVTSASRFCCLRTVCFYILGVCDGAFSFICYV